MTPEEKQRFLPSVELVVGEIVYLFAEKNFIADVGTSLYRIYASFFAASLIAVPLGVLMGCFVKLRALISPTTGGWRYLPRPPSRRCCCYGSGRPTSPKWRCSSSAASSSSSP